MLKKDFTSKYFIEVLRTKPPSYVAEFSFWGCHHLPMKMLKQKKTLEKFITNAETYLEPRQIFTMELFDLNYFRLKTPS